MTTRRAPDPLQKYLLNPLDKLAFRLRVPPPGDALLETIGRRAGKARVTPLCAHRNGAHIRALRAP